MMTRKEARAVGERVHDLLMSGDDRNAGQELTDFTRLFHREAAFLPNIIDPTDFDASQLVPQMHTDQPVMYFEYEINSPGAIQVDFGTGPTDFIVRGRRYPLTLQKTQTRQSVFETLHLHTYKHDVRAVMGDAKAKDLAARNDAKLINAVNEVVGPVDTVRPWVRQAMHRNLGSALDFTSFVAGGDIMRGTDYAITPECVLMNHMRESDFALMGVEELQGTQKSVDIMFNGFTETKFYDKRLMFTIKKKLVPIAQSYWFGKQEWLGRYVEWIQPTMEIERKDTRVSFYLYQVNGLTIANPAAVSIVEYLT